MTSVRMVISRSFSTSSRLCGKRNFTKFHLYNKRGFKEFKEKRNAGLIPDMPVYKRGLRDPGYTNEKGQFITVPEMVPELIVPDLTGFPLMPYVSHRASGIEQSEFTAKQLFESVYSKKISDDFKDNKLDADGNPLEPNSHEAMSPEVAKLKAQRTGCDLYTGNPKDFELKFIEDYFPNVEEETKVEETKSA